VKPGDFITPESAAKVQSLVSPDVYYECCYINMGAVNKQFLTIDAMVRAANS
jgi:hypothetical protein